MQHSVGRGALPAALNTLSAIKTSGRGVSRRAALQTSTQEIYDLLHIDTKKLGRIECMGHRITGNPRDNTDGVGWDLFVAVDDHARVAFTQMKPTERRSRAIAFLRASIRHFAQLGVTVRRMLPITARRSARNASPRRVEAAATRLLQRSCCVG